jgi:hypothetical protein
MKKDYEAPELVVLGTVLEMTLSNTTGPNPDIQLNSPSFP